MWVWNGLVFVRSRHESDRVFSNDTGAAHTDEEPDPPWTRRQPRQRETLERARALKRERAREQRPDGEVASPR